MKIEEINNNTCFFNYSSEEIKLNKVNSNDFSNHIKISDGSKNSLLISLKNKKLETRKLIYEKDVSYSDKYSPYHYSLSYRSSSRITHASSRTNSLYSLTTYNENDDFISFSNEIYPFNKNSLRELKKELNDIFLSIEGNVSISFENIVFKDKNDFFQKIKNTFEKNGKISNISFLFNDEEINFKISHSSIINNHKDYFGAELQNPIIKNCLNINNIKGSNIIIENTNELKNSEIKNLISESKGNLWTKIFDSKIENLTTEGELEISLSNIKNLTSKSKEGEKTIISNSKIENLTTEGELEISLSNIKNLTSKSKEGEKTIISNSKIENLTTEGELEISLSNIKNLTSKSKEGEKTIISNSKIENLIIKAWVEIIESTIKATIKSKIEISGNIEKLGPTQKTFFEKTFLTIGKEELLIEDSIFQKVDNFFIGNNNSSINNCISEIKRSTLQNLKNYLKIDGTIEIIGSVIGNKDNFYKGGLIFFNNKNEHIKISDSELKEDVSIFQNAVINNAILSGNCSVFQNSEIFGDKKHIRISGYTKLFGRSQIRGIETNISGFINIYGESNISGNPTIYGNVNILDDARVSGKAELKKEEIINKFNERYS